MNGEKLAVKGMTRAAEHADRANYRWTVEATRWMTHYALANQEEFMTEEARAFIQDQWGVPPPPDSRAYGRIMRNLQKRGIIKHVRYDRATNASTHGGIRSVWVRA